MTRETKVGLFVGMGVVILIAILVSDHLSQVQQQQPAQYAQSIDAPLIDTQLPAPRAGGGQLVPPAAPVTPLEIPTSVASATQERSRRGPAIEPDRLEQDLLPLSATRSPEEVEGPLIAADDLPGSRSLADALNQAVQRSRKMLRLRADGQPIDPVEEPDVADALVPESTPVPAPRRKQHTVARGETLSQIATAYYGSSREWRTIYEANRKVIANPNVLKPGTELEIPNRAADTAAAERRVAVAAPRDYSVQKGETLAKIAERFLGSQGQWKRLYEFNKDRISNPNRLKPGTVIRIPGR